MGCWVQPVGHGKGQGTLPVVGEAGCGSGGEVPEARLSIADMPSSHILYQWYSLEDVKKAAPEREDQELEKKPSCQRHWG